MSNKIFGSQLVAEDQNELLERQSGSSTLNRLLLKKEEVIAGLNEKLLMLLQSVSHKQPIYMSSSWATKALK